MTREEILALCQRELAAWNAHDAAAVGEFFAPEASVRDAGGETAAGRDAIAARARMYMDAFPDLRLDMVAIEVDGDTFVLEWKASGTNGGLLARMPPTNRAVVVEGCDVARVGDDGLIHSETDYWNEASMMRQLGVMPEPAAAAQPA
jgi:steroid delta-isomerase-like uncharacterized protein